MDTRTGIDTCGCCEGAPPAAPVYNAPGLEALRYRADAYPGFRARLLRNLPLARPDEALPDPRRPLAQLLSRDSADPTVALVDAFACVADVLGFYQERIANEGYLRTATERRSVLELARSVGYELDPGLAAAAYLAFTVEDAPGAPARCTLAQGQAVQSVPVQGKLPQVFETSAAIEARAAWNALRARQSRPADLALYGVAEAGAVRTALVLLGPHGSFPAATANLHAGVPALQLARLDPALAHDDPVDALEVRRIYCTESAAALAKGELLLFVGSGSGKPVTLVLRVVAVEAEPARQRIRVDLEPLPAPNDPAPPPAGYWTVPYRPVPVRGSVHSGLAFATTVPAVRAPVLVHAAGSAVADLAPAPARAVPAFGTFAFGARVGFFGCNAPKWRSLPHPLVGDAYPYGWDTRDPELSPAPAAGKDLDSPRTIWTDSQGGSLLPAHAVLERPVPELVRASWMVFEAPDVAPLAYPLFDARQVSRADYGLSGRGMALTLADRFGAPAMPASPPPFTFRASTAHVASRPLVLAELPIEEPVAAGTRRLELETGVQLVPGQPLAFAGPGAGATDGAAAEIAVVDAVEQAGGRTTLTLREALRNSYRRDGLRINANVAHATHGESVAEVLGSGDASQPGQRFVLGRPPTTFLSVPTARGARTTLEVRVGGVRWDELPSLYEAAPDSQVYMTRIDDDGRMQLVFGDGVHGARLPTGSANLAARYRSGLGPDGEVDAGSLSLLRAMPLGLRSVTNPLAAAGAAAPERLADARRNAPLTLRTFGRVVSLPDYADFAQGFPGIRKARGDLLWADGGQRVHVTVTGDTGPAPGADVLAHLAEAIGLAGDGACRFSAGACAVRRFVCAASVAIDPRYLRAEVLDAARTRLRAAFGFEARALAQSVTAAEVLAVIHEVPGVLAADLTRLEPEEAVAGPGAPVLAAVPAFAAAWDPLLHAVLPAELLLVAPDAIELAEMTP
jgi:hypothetical protein